MVIKECSENNILCSCGGITYYCEINGEIAGRICLFRSSWYFSELRHLYVYKKFRRTGVARFISKELFKIITTPLILATVRGDNPEARNMLKSFGYKEGEHFTSTISGKEVIMCVKNMGGKLEDE